MALLLSQTEFAARHKVGKPAVSNWKRKGLLVFAPDPDRPNKLLVDVEKSDLLVRGSIDQTRGRPRSADAAPQGAGGSGDTVQPPARGPAPLNALEAARLDEMLQRTRGRRIENDARLGNLVAISEYERRAGDLGRMVREGVHAVLRQQAERIAAETDPRTIIAVLGEAFDQLFARVSSEVEAQASLEREVDQVLAQVTADEDELESAEAE